MENEKKLKNIEIIMSNGASDVYNLEAAEKVSRRLGIASAEEHKFSGPIEIYPNETVEYTMSHIIQVLRIYKPVKDPEPENAYDDSESDYARIETLKGV